MTQHTVGMFSGVCTKLCLGKSYTDVWTVDTVTMVLYLFLFVVSFFYFLSLNKLQVGSTRLQVTSQTVCSTTQIKMPPTPPENAVDSDASSSICPFDIKGATASFEFTVLTKYVHK